MNKKVSKKWLSLLMAVVMVLSLVPGTVIAAETAPDKHGTATVTLMNEKKDKLSMYDPILDAKADITVSGGNVTVKLLVVSPLPSHPDQSADGTMTNVRVHYDGVEYDTVSAVGTGAIMTAKATDSIFGIKAGEQYTAQVLTVTLPEAAVTEGARLYIKAYISAIMSTEAVFRLAFSDLTWDEAGTADPDAEAAAAVDAMIADIGEVTLDSGTAITEARAAYDGLTDAQKALVKNLAVLEAAEARLAELQTPAAQVVAESAALRAEKQASADGKAPFTLSLNKPRNISVIEVTFAADADVSVEGLNGFSVVGVKNSVATLVYTADGQLSADGAVDVVRFNVAAEGDTTMRVTDLVIAGRDANETAVYGKITGAIDPNEAVFISNIYDLNKDEMVDLLDLVVAQEFYQAAAESDVWADAVKCDFDHSGVIDIADYIDLCSHFTQPR